jgi:hypothetical protein
MNNMNFNLIKIIVCLILIIAFLIMAFTTKNINISHLSICLVIITGALLIKHVSPKNPS